MFTVKDWVKAFEDRKIIEDIPREVRKLESRYWSSICLSGAGIMVGLVLFFVASGVKMQLAGVLAILLGNMGIFATKIACQVRLSLFWLVWDSQNRLRAEMDKMAATDLQTKKKREMGGPARWIACQGNLTL